MSAQHSGEFVKRRAVNGAGWSVWELTIPATCLYAEAALLAEASALAREAAPGCVTLSGIDWRDGLDAYRLTLFMEDVQHEPSADSGRTVEP